MLYMRLDKDKFQKIIKNSTYTIKKLKLKVIIE